MKKFLIILSTAATLAACSGVPREAALPPPAVIADPYGSPAQFIEGMALAERDIPLETAHPARAAIVPHHLVSTEAVAAGIRALQPGGFERVLLLSPDHFYRCPTLLCTTNATFRTQFGSITSSEEGVRALLRSPDVSLDDDLFAREHGVTAVIPYIAHYLTGAQLIPVTVEPGYEWAAHRETLYQALLPLLDEKTAIVVSSDFSHYLPLSQAETADRETMSAFLAGDLNGIAALKNPDQSDCPSCLWLLARAGLEQGYFNPSVLLHTNSAELLTEPDVSSTTSHFAVVFYQNDALSSSDIAFAGDVTVTRGSGALSAEALSAWSGTGARVANLEGPLAERCENAANPYIFCNPLSRWSGIADLADLWVVPNNHMLDQGLGRVAETKRLLLRSGVVPVAEEGASASDVTVVAFTTLLNPLPHSTTFDLSAARKRAFAAIANAPDSDLVVAYVHDGMEFDPLPSPASSALYRLLIDAGADAVIVAHSHVPGDMELYRGKPIFRGLGNFIFDQRQSTATSTARIIRMRERDGRILFESLLVR